MDNKSGPRFPSLDKSIAKRATCEKIPIYQPFVQLIKLSEILGHVLQGLYTPQAKKYSAEHGSDAIVTCLDKALSDWRAALPPTLQISGSSIKKLDTKGKTPLLSISGKCNFSFLKKLYIFKYYVILSNNNFIFFRINVSFLLYPTYLIT